MGILVKDQSVDISPALEQLGENPSRVVLPTLESLNEFLDAAGLPHPTMSAQVRTDLSDFLRAAAEAKDGAFVMILQDHWRRFQLKLEAREPIPDNWFQFTRTRA
jgi:hypothetical protein